jgi:hypothetical protein
MRPFFPAFAAATIALTGCDLTGGSSSSSGSGSNSATGQAAVQILATSEQASANSTVQAIQNMPDKVGGRLTPATRASLVSANSTFRSDLLTGSAKTSARFGLAVTSLALRMDDFSDSLQTMSDNGLLSGDASSLFNTTATKVVQNQVVASRALTTGNPATIRQLQTSIEQGFLPTVDSVVTLLNACWSDANFTYRFPVSGFSSTDSLTIGRGDIGIALAGVMAVRAYLAWFVSQDLSVEVSGQGFPNSFAWFDTLANINDSLGPKGTYQTLAFENLKSLYSGTFLTVRSGYTDRVDSIPSQLAAAANIAKSAAYYAYKLQTDLRHGLVELSASDYNAFAQAMDSVNVYLSGARDFVVAPHTEYEYVYSPAAKEYITNAVRYPGYTVRVDVSKLITLKDHKVFLPEFQWNETNTWAKNGPFSLLSGNTVTLTFRQLKALDVQSPLDLRDRIVWTDPTFSGVFPSFNSSNSVLTKLDSLDQKASGTSAVAGRLLPRALGL